MSIDLCCTQAPGAICTIPGTSLHSEEIWEKAAALGEHPAFVPNGYKQCGRKHDKAAAPVKARCRIGGKASQMPNSNFSELSGTGYFR